MRSAEPEERKEERSDADLENEASVNEEQYLEMRIKVENSVPMCDPITQFLVKQSVNLLLMFLAFACGTLPTSLINLGYLGFMVYLAYNLLNGKD